jgi:uncharacterized protein YecT (DUF1311 family)
VSNKDVKQDALNNLADALTEDILNTPDDELLREVEEDYGDPRALANKFDQILERAEKQVFGTARSAASPQVRSSVLDLPYRPLEWFSTLFGSGPGRSETQFQLFSVNRMVWAGAAAVLIVLILAPAVFRSMSEFDERSRQLAALEKELLARSEQLAAREKELLARSDMPPRAGAMPLRPASTSEPIPVVAHSETQAPPAATLPEIIPCKNLTEPFEHLICADADLAFWQNLVSEIYQHRWRQLDTNGQQILRQGQLEILRQGQLDWLRNMRVDCNVTETGTWNAAEMARARSCVLQSTKERVAVLSNN